MTKSKEKIERAAPISFKPIGKDLTLLDALVVDVEKETGLEVGRSGVIRMAIHSLARKRKIKI
jgi:hypothetical protein